MKETGKQKHFEYVSYEDAQKLEKERQETLEKIRKDAQKTVAALCREKIESGESKYDFETKETSDEYVIYKGEGKERREYHITKVHAADPNEIRKAVEYLHQFTYSLKKKQEGPE